MITATAWVPRGFAAQFPTRAEFNDEEYERIAHLAQIKLDDAEADLEDASAAVNEDEEGEEGAATTTTTNGDAMDDDVTEINVLGGSTTATTTTTKNIKKKKSKKNGIQDKEEYVVRLSLFFVLLESLKLQFGYWTSSVG